MACHCSRTPARRLRGWSQGARAHDPQNADQPRPIKARAFENGGSSRRSIVPHLQNADTTGRDATWRSLKPTRGGTWQSSATPKCASITSIPRSAPPKRDLDASQHDSARPYARTRFSGTGRSLVTVASIVAGLVATRVHEEPVERAASRKTSRGSGWRKGSSQDLSNERIR